MNKKRRTIKILVSVFMMITILFITMACGFSEQSSGVLDIIGSYRGYTRVISKEEYDFYKYFVERDLPEPVSDEALDELVKAYAGKVNAAFYLGNKLGLCEAYSFEALQLRMEQENAARQVKLQQGEAVYGLEQFNLQTYFQYTMDNLETSLHQYLEENADQEILKQAEKYYEENEEIFRSRESVTYNMSVNGATETVTADGEQLSMLGKSDPGLADFLTAAEIGEIYSDLQNYQERQIVLKDIVYSEEGFENNKELVLYRYVRYKLYESIIEQVAENNPVEFEVN